jgi:hypothetical protein
VKPLYPQKLALTSLKSGGRSVGIVRSQTEATDFLLLPLFIFSLSEGITVLLLPSSLFVLLHLLLLLLLLLLLVVVVVAVVVVVSLLLLLKQYTDVT